MASKQNDDKKPPCYSRMDMLITGDCNKCSYSNKCFDETFSRIDGFLKKVAKELG